MNSPCQYLLILHSRIRKIIKKKMVIIWNSGSQFTHANFPMTESVLYSVDKYIKKDISQHWLVLFYKPENETRQTEGNWKKLVHTTFTLHLNLRIRKIKISNSYTDNFNTQKKKQLEKKNTLFSHKYWRFQSQYKEFNAKLPGNLEKLIGWRARSDLVHN